MISRSGTNQLHGTATTCMTIPAAPGARLFDLQKAHMIDHTFGGSPAGPLMILTYSGRNRTFFMMSYDGHTSPEPGVRNGFRAIAGLPWRRDFSSLRSATKDPLSQAPFPGNLVPSNRFSQCRWHFRIFTIPRRIPARWAGW
jgi:hypothetical protein